MIGDERMLVFPPEVFDTIEAAQAEWDARLAEEALEDELELELGYDVLVAAGVGGNPSQARVPKGNDNGGEWTDTAETVADNLEAVASRKRKAARGKTRVTGTKAKGTGVREKLTLGYTTQAELNKARNRALEKKKLLPEPTDADRAAAHARHAKSKRQGGDDRPGSRRRKVLKQNMLDEFGDGTTCACLNCGARLDISTVSMDRLIPGSDNGRYTRDNLIPMDYDCNRARSNTDFDDMADEWDMKVAA
jgi:hypothetical protein